MESWRVVVCDITLERSMPGGRTAVARAFGEDYTLYMTALEDERALCRFAARFIATFDFFLEALGRRDDDAWRDPAAADGAIPQFPGVLNLDG
ncbi:MAG: hypothetical protein MI724_10225 [Spirochaetales bacterium]|nr:hypothetical protein [Spirochaetales bacterium]